MTFSASDTYQDTSYSPYRARPSSRPNPWCTNYDASSTWWAIDLGTSQSISKIELVKTDDDAGYVLTYKISYQSQTGEAWTYYSQNSSQVFALMFGSKHNTLFYLQKFSDCIEKNSICHLSERSRNDLLL